MARIMMFKLDDSDDLGLAQVEVLHPKRLLQVNGRLIQTFSVRILDIIKPSFSTYYKIGKTYEVGDGRLTPAIKLKREE